MKNKMLHLCFILLITLFSHGKAQENIVFEDLNFKRILLQANHLGTEYQLAKNLSGEFFKIDSNHDGEISPKEALQVKELYLKKAKIDNLNQIGYFKNLQTLNCSNNRLAVLDLSQLHELKVLFCSYNNLKQLNLQNSPQLQSLSCVNNQLKSLDLSPLSQLTTLDAGQNPFVDLDFSQNKMLKKLNLYGNRLLKKINLKNHSPLDQLWLENLPKLQAICCDANETSSLEIQLSSFNKVRNPIWLSSACNLRSGRWFSKDRQSLAIGQINQANGTESSCRYAIIQNPVGAILRWKEPITTQVSIINSHGNCVKTTMMMDGWVDVSDLSLGHYFLLLEDPKPCQAVKFIKE
jgi:hypothetical protein